MFTSEQLQLILETQKERNFKDNPKWLDEDTDWLMPAIENISSMVNGLKDKKIEPTVLHFFQKRMLGAFSYFVSYSVYVCNKDGLDPIDTMLDLQGDAIKFNNRIFNFKEDNILDNLRLLLSIIAIGSFDIALVYRIINQLEISAEDICKFYVWFNNKE